MPARKKKATTSKAEAAPKEEAASAPASPTTATAKGQTAPADVGLTVDHAKTLEVGYVGFAPDANPNEAYSLATGPDGPPVNKEHVR